MRYIKIKVTEQMLKDLKDCHVLMKAGKRKDCRKCSLDGGRNFECLADKKWCEEREL